ncbi:MAG: MFS transporter [Oscillospiraceae bacterium]|jgi:MFS family permease
MRFGQKTIETMSDRKRNGLFFAVEGACFAAITSLGNNTNNLFLSRLGASDYQLSMLTMLAQVVSMVCLVPLAIFTDRLRNKRRMVVILLLFIGVCYLCGAAVPFLGGAALYPMIAFIGLAVGGVELCTSTWQAFFADATPPEDRNRTFAVRNQTMFVINICLPLLAGFLLTAQGDRSAQIITHQVYYCVIAAAAGCNIWMLSKIRGGTVREPAGKSFRDFWAAIKALVHNRRFLFFAAVALLFYTTWRLDGTVFYLGQVKYVGLSDFWYTFSNVCCGIAQFVSIRFWARRNEQLGVRFSLIFGAVGLVLSPLCIILPLQFEGTARLVVHLVLRCTSDLTFATITLNILQNLLQVVEEKNRALSIAAYTTLISLTSAVSPMIGVSIYTALGANQAAIIQTFLIILALRLLSVGALVLRWWLLRGEPK